MPLEDISIVIKETGMAAVTSALLIKLAERGMPLITCGNGHLPTGLFLPFQRHSVSLRY